ncbi:MAG TPA: pyridine nucleotide-disulfide oxidoreductase, partial [Clostridiales bacterium]|nr:pyridine nucleotide-disulfide oxidoreductase [Clostridiales bacterium]
HEVAGNRVSEDAVRIPLSEIFADTRVKFVTDEIVSYDFCNNRVCSAKNNYDYDYLVVAVGSTPNFFGIPGLQENALTIWSFEDAVRIRDHIIDCFVKAASEQDPEERKRLLTFVVGGAGFTGIEMIGELAQWVKKLCREHEIPRTDVRLVILDMLDRILSVLSEKNSKKGQEYLEKKLGVEVLVNAAVKQAYADRIEVGDTVIPSRTLIWTAGVRASIDADDMDVDKGGSERVLTDAFLRLKGIENVYGIGDFCVVCKLEGKASPALVENAIQTGHTAAVNVLRHLRGQPLEKSEVKLHGVMVSIGNYFAVSSLMGKEYPSWISLLAKYMVNVHYLFGIMGFAGPLTYLRHELLHRRQQKTFLEKHYTKTTQTWWLFPLRLFLGYTWLSEGIAKLQQGWLGSPKLAAFLGMAGDTDATTAATGVAGVITGVGKMFVDINLKIFHLQIGQMENIVSGITMEGNVFAKLKLLEFGDFELVNQILKHIVLASDGVTMVFQVLVVLAEIALGLMFLGGAFTFIASVLSIGLMLMFLTSTGVYAHTWWVFFGAFAAMGGSGRAFGLDHWIMPYLDRVWTSWRKNAKLRLFFPKSNRKANRS